MNPLVGLKEEGREKDSEAFEASESYVKELIKKAGNYSDEITRIINRVDVLKSLFRARSYGYEPETDNEVTYYAGLEDIMEEMIEDLCDLNSFINSDFKDFAKVFLEKSIDTIEG